MLNGESATSSAYKVTLRNATLPHETCDSVPKVFVKLSQWEHCPPLFHGDLLHRVDQHLGMARAYNEQRYKKKDKITGLLFIEIDNQVLRLICLSKACSINLDILLYY